MRGTFGSSQRSASFLRSQAAHCNSRNHKLMESPGCRRKKTRIEISKHFLRLVEVSNQQEPPDLKIAGKPRVQSIAVLFQGQPCSIKLFRGPAQITQGKRDFGLRYRASRAGYRFFRTEGARS